VAPRIMRSGQCTPIFDTNVFGDVQRGLISQADWQCLLSHRPRHGWPLSQVTALELLAGVTAVRPENFASVKERIELAYHLSKGKVLNDPRVLICRDVLNIPFPADQLAPAAPVISKYLDVVRRAATMKQLLSDGVPYRGKRARVNGPSILADLMAGPKAQWRATVERIADERYPAWRELFRRTGRRLPPEMRRELEPLSTWQPQRPDYAKTLLGWLHGPTTSDAIAGMLTRLDAAIEFTIFITREFLLRNYSPEKHHSDVFDQFQLQYLAIDRFAIVSGDPDLSKRTARSSQADRIMTFDQFLARM
jgi:hypothetical protein